MSKTTLKDLLQEQTKERIARIRHQRDFAQSKGKVLDLVDHLVEKHSLEVYHNVTDYGTYLYLTAKNLSGLKDEKLAELLNSLVYCGADRESTEDYPASYSRAYSFVWNGDESEVLTVLVTAEFGENSETCKRVITGYREPSTEPIPIYELRCEGDATDATGVKIGE